MNIKISKDLAYALKLIVSVAFLTTPFVSCTQPSPKQSSEKTVEVMPSTQKTAPEKSVFKPRTELEYPSSSCVVDVGRVLAEPKYAEKYQSIRDRNWSREKRLITQPQWRPFVLDTVPEKHVKMVSIEFAYGSLGGHYRPGFACVRLRYLSSQTIQDTKTWLAKVGLSDQPNSTQLTGMLAQGKVNIHLNLNPDYLTQIDVAIEPRDKPNLSALLNRFSTSVQWLSTQKHAAFEYGFFVSGRPGLDFPGLARGVVITEMSELTFDEKMHELEFMENEKGEHVYTNKFHTFAYRKFNKGRLSVFWQQRLNQSDTAAFVKR